MDIQRIRNEVAQAKLQFAYVEANPTTLGAIQVKVALQTSAGNTYIATIDFEDYPNRHPTVAITKPVLRTTHPHRYTNGTICYIHPTMWNPGRHNLTFVIGRIAKWLNKYEIWNSRGRWPGAEIEH